jgi:hypothetical protein
MALYSTVSEPRVLTATVYDAQGRYTDAGPVYKRALANENPTQMRGPVPNGIYAGICVQFAHTNGYVGVEPNGKVAAYGEHIAACRA